MPSDHDGLVGKVGPQTRGVHADGVTDTWRGRGHGGANAGVSVTLAARVTACVHTGGWAVAGDGVEADTETGLSVQLARVIV